MITKLKKIKLHSLHIAILLAVATLLGSIGIGLIVQTNPLIESFDRELYKAIHKGFYHPVIDYVIHPFNFNFLPAELSPGRMPSYYYFMFLGTIVYLAIFNRQKLLWAIFCFLFGTVLAYYITALDWQVVYRERPFLHLENQIDEKGINAWKNLSSFPSGHARETALYATLIASFIPFLKIPAISFIIFIGYSRVYIGAHYPTDVLAGILIGVLTAKVSLITAREIQIILSSRKGDDHAKKPL